MSTSNQINSPGKDSILQRISISNFKSIRNTVVELRPLTILLGGNSAGKSSLLQALVLSAQNFRTGTTMAFDLNHSALTLGPLKDLFHKGAKLNEEVQLNYVFCSNEEALSPNPRNSFEISLELATSKANLERSSVPLNKCRITQKVDGQSARLVISPGTYFKSPDAEPAPCTITGSFFTSPTMYSSYLYRAAYGQKSDREKRTIDAKFLPVSEDRFLPQIISDRDIYLVEKVWRGLLERFLVDREYQKQKNVWKVDERKLIPELTSALKSFQPSIVKIDLTPAGQKKTEVLNKWLLRLTSGLEKDSTNVINQLRLNTADFARQDKFKLLGEIKVEEFAYFLARSANSKQFAWLSEKVPQILPLASYTKAPDYQSAAREYEIHKATLASRIYYLGPLRAHLLSEQKNSLAPEKWAPIGIRGESLAYQLNSDQNKKKRDYPVPAGKPGIERFTTEKTTLQIAVSKWVKWFELGEKLEQKDEGVWGSFLELDNEKFHQKGTGISQVLPVLTICLMAGRGSLTMIEQPELHLHPALQQKLGTFFAEISKTGRRLLVETHSEYIVTRVRRQIATGALDNKDVALTFATAKIGKLSQRETVYESVPITTSGLVPRWPQSFYDFTADDKLTIFEANHS
jgi:predicted ATPase